MAIFDAATAIRQIEAADRAAAEVGREVVAAETAPGRGFQRRSRSMMDLCEPASAGFVRDIAGFPAVDPNALLAQIAGAPGADVDDKAMLEVLLFLGHGETSTTALADQLLARFASLGGVLNASTRELCAVEGITERTASMFKAIQATLRKVLREPLEKPITIGSWQALTDYLGVDMRFERVETLRLLFLDRKNHLLADETMHRGTVDHTPLYPREVARRALELSASALVMAHNHPSGDPTPSTADIQTTRQVEAALQTLGITLHDHVIVAARGLASLRSLGHLAIATA